MRIARSKDATTAYEYGCDLRRLYPWANVSDPLWGSAVCSVRPGEATHPHSHDEDETFIITSGQGLMSVDDETEPVGKGDVIFLPRNCRHTIQNASNIEPLEFLTIWWGSPEANARMINIVSGLTPATGPLPKQLQDTIGRA
ncbi:cupin domain-containing protein [Rhizobium mongolense]|uniref:Mannose-6-phosphate isomerase-like protein (Cupin superfamily) n=3 Tax=Rhizobium mongolense TaxID=57676 RepID=A0ABR6J0Z9_9HYPH|nr:cupin domain-containing protein [Rhizobium mongolense]MBB4233344.1 mannose-6-phosphate isomerase-like protein (cupin superfamily) [Rhizobium mongolense]TVZ75319.1 Cupin domain-containing protein [Rhizobium mongolense USDA 1844]